MPLPQRLKLPVVGQTFVTYSGGVVQFTGMVHPGGGHTSHIVASKKDSSGNSLTFTLSRDVPEPEKLTLWRRGFFLHHEPGSEQTVREIADLLIAAPPAHLVPAPRNQLRSEEAGTWWTDQGPQGKEAAWT